jgi:hypothetical protein
MASTTIPSPTSSSDVIQGHLVSIANTGILGGDVWAYALATSPWANILPRGQFATGRGARQRTMHFERALVGTTGKMTWADHGALGNSSAATGNSPPDIAVGSRSLPPVSVIQASQKVDEYGLKWAACESPRFDVRDAIFNYSFTEQFGKYYEKVKEGAGRAWEYELREAYFRMCKYKYLIGAPLSSSPTNPYFDLSVVAPQDFSDFSGYTDNQLGVASAAISNGYSTAHSVLTNGVLQDLRPKVQRNGAFKGGKTNSLIPLVCSPEQQYYLLHEPGMRTDLRYGNAGALLKAMGDAYTTDFLGYNFIPDPEVPRFTATDDGSDTNSFTEILPWTYQAGNLSTTISLAATALSGAATLLTVGTTVGLVANNVVRIAPTSASDDEYSGEFTVLSVPSSTTVIINKAFTDTATGELYLVGNGESGWVPNPSYDTAPYEASFIVFPQVCEIQTVDYPSSLGQGSNFDSQPKPLGSFKWKNIANEDTNPDGTMGYFRGIFEYAVKPEQTEHGYFLLHRRAPAITLASPSFNVVSGLGQLS